MRYENLLWQSVNNGKFLSYIFICEIIHIQWDNAVPFLTLDFTVVLMEVKRVDVNPLMRSQETNYFEQ